MRKHESRPEAGLFCVKELERGKHSVVPLLGVKVEAEVREVCARVRVAQRYANREKEPIEAVYVFPLDEGAAVCEFEALIGEVRIAGEVREREEAFKLYDEALEEGHGAYLLEEERPDVFTASLGNLAPGQEATVVLTYVTELAPEGDALRFTLPTTVSPRYAPREDALGVGKTPAEALNPPVAFRVPYGMEIAVSCEMGSAIRSMESPSHPIAVTLHDRTARVELGTRETAMDRDFVLRCRVADPAAPRAWVERDEDGRRAALICFRPELEEAEIPAEIVFLVDRSGSMGGPSIEEARNALQLCLRSLPEGSLFNVVGFGSSYQMLFAESRPYDEASLREASEHVSRIDADLGGTEILEPIRAILASRPGAERLPRRLFVLTDGEVTNTDAVIRLVREHAGATRVFTFGIGPGASHHLVKGMARAGGGAAELIFPGERVEPKVLRQLQRALSPALEDVRVDWGGLAVKQAPGRPLAVFPGEMVLVYGFLESAEAGEARLTANGPRGPVSFTVPLDPEHALRGNLIGTLAARALIRELEEEDGDREELVRLGVAYGLVSRATSFVAIEKREAPVEGERKLRKVPIALTTRWGGLEDRALSPPGFVAASVLPPPSAAAPLFAIDASFDEPLLEATAPPPVAFSSERRRRSRPRSRRPSERPLDRLVRLQRADGSWDLSEELATILDRPLAELEGKLAGAEGARELARRAWATALAILWLAIEANENVAEWLLLEKKARRWLAAVPARLATGEDWLEAAAEVFRARA